jgi:hypothetical protein
VHCARGEGGGCEGLSPLRTSGSHLRVPPRGEVDFIGCEARHFRVKSRWEEEEEEQLLKAADMFRLAEVA